jgi:glycosyltransferase involved in cell wall biosynthesis
MTPMRILFAAPVGVVTSAHGGIETYARELTAGIEARGHEVIRMVCDPHAILSNLSWHDRVPRWRFRQRYYFWRGIHIQDYRFHTALGRITRREIRRVRPHIVHALHLDYLASLLEAGALPTVVTCYGLEVQDAPPIRASLERATAVHCDSDFTRSLVVSVVGERPRQFTATWGVREHESPRPRDRGPDDFDLVTVSRLVPRKNVATVLRALALLNDPTIRYAVVGDGPELEPLRRLAAELGLDSVKFLGALPNDEMRRVLLRGRVFVMCPRSDLASDVEGLGLVYYEACGLGLPSIGAHSGGVPEAVGDAGILVREPLNAEEVAAAIRSALTPASYQNLCRAVERRQSTHSWERYLSNWEALYSSLLHGSSRAQQAAL